MKVEIIIPTYNRHGSLQSILNDISHQIYSDFIVWVCSDGPDMKVFDIVNEFNNKFEQSFNYLHTPKRTNDWGISPRKLCVEQLKDESLVCFIDDDNSISSRYLSTLVNPFLNNIDIDISVGQIFLADYEINGERVIPTGPLSKNFYYAYGYIDPLCMMIKSKVVKDNIKYWGINRDHDYEFMKHIIISYKSIFIPDIIGVHR